MSTFLQLSASEYGQMFERGAFGHLNRKIELIRREVREVNTAGPCTTIWLII
jgi:hypothetical protein